MDFNLTEGLYHGGTQDTEILGGYKGLNPRKSDAPVLYVFHSEVSRRGHRARREVSRRGAQSSQRFTEICNSSSGKNESTLSTE